MLSTERAEFEAQLAVLFGGFPQFLTPPRVEAYWRGLAKMPLSTFVRCVDQALGEQGTDKLPTVKTLWELSKQLRAHRPAQSTAPAAAFDPFVAFGNRCLMAFLRRKGGSSSDSLRAMVALKNRVMDGAKEANAKPEDAAELRDVLMAAFERVSQPMSEAEILEHMDHYTRTGRVRAT